ncbi:YdiU family protein [Aestuariibacter sp. GS-14]|uniref:protein adenylyltransferase SelO n=1 Tax=Aestuariibacter sp. GS-14 TaxID=2590670 RepID=UPI00112E60AF|nr:YdiU family protein [Aestuariibacter sp. GS-14]TPV54311.1 YdiU family protein [Aestuariibacter sp. GS-14]
MQLSHHYASELTDTVSLVRPQPLSDISLRMTNHALVQQYQLPDAWFSHQGIIEQLFNEQGMLAQHAVAQKYGGHQFGQWNPYLGDGRGLLLGEVTDPNGNQMDLHLKGAGQTPYSRHADGRAVLRSTLREYIGSEALHHLGIPSSRSLCLFSSSERVYRELPEPGAMMIRMAPSHLRFGHFEYYFHSKAFDTLDKLMDFTLTRHFPDCAAHAEPHKALLKAITLRTARMVALWQVHGFVHGVMNTDNMSIHGITFDYGPYAFMEQFKSDAVFNHSDHEGRYAFDRQPGIALWNLNALAYAFSRYISVDDIKACLTQFEPAFLAVYRETMLARIGLDNDKEHEPCLNMWLAMLGQNPIDYTQSFRWLAEADPTQSVSSLRDHFIDRNSFDGWWQDYRQRRLSAAHTPDSLLASNPLVVARTQSLQRAIEAAEQGDYSVAEQLLLALNTPYQATDASAPFEQPGNSDDTVSLSCSS